MGLKLDTTTIRRLTDVLLENGQLQERAATSGDAKLEGDRLQAVIDRVSPFAETMCLTMLADGEVAELERETIRGALQVLTDGALGQEILDDMLQRCEAVANEQGVEYRLQAIGAQLCASRQDREMAFTLAAAVAVADNEVAEEESSLVECIAEWYGVSSKRCQQILEQVAN
ncbi:MAG: hypothetical protein COC20_03960 [Cellvibrionales bacterium]|nr:MAG: hypothetical protein COC20_03960 [Cellvibrionales bacterium]